MPPIELRTLSKESLVIGSLLLVAFAVGAVLNAMSEVASLVETGDFVREGFVLAGTAVAILYVLVRSVELARTIDDTDADSSVGIEEFAREGAVLAIPVVLWFTLAGLATALMPFDPLNAAVETLVLAGTRTGILTAALYILARVVAFLQSSDSGERRVVSADD